MSNVERWAEIIKTENLITFDYVDFMRIFYNNRASILLAVYNEDRTNKKVFELIEKLYLKVLEFNPEDETANYNLGSFYYNEGVDVINKDGDKAKGKTLMKKGQYYITK